MVSAGNSGVKVVKSTQPIEGGNASGKKSTPKPFQKTPRGGPKSPANGSPNPKQNPKSPNTKQNQKSPIAKQNLKTPNANQNQKTPKSANKGQKQSPNAGNIQKTPKTANQGKPKPPFTSPKNAGNQGGKPLNGAKTPNQSPGKKQKPNKTPKPQQEVSPAPKLQTPRLKRKIDSAEEPSGKKQKFDFQEPEVQARTVFLGNFPLVSAEDQVRKHFEKLGQVDSVHRKRLSKNADLFYGFVRFASPDQAAKAIATDKSVVKGHHLKVSHSQIFKGPDENTIYVGNFSYSAADEDLWRVFQYCGPISSVHIMHDKNTGKSLGRAFVTFESAESVEKALKVDAAINGRKLYISARKDKPVKQAKREIKQEVKKENESDEGEEEDEDDDVDEEEEGEDSDEEEDDDSDE